MNNSVFQRFKFLVFIILVAVSITLNNLLMYLFLNFVAIFFFSKKESKSISYLKKPKFFLSIAILTIVPIVFAYGNESEFVQTIQMIVKILLRGFLILQTMSILVSHIDTSKILHYLNKRFPNFNENLSETIETMGQFKNILTETNVQTQKRKLIKQFIFHPIVSIEKVLTKLWNEYTKENK